MKKFTLMLASALVLGLSSCSKDDSAGFALNTTDLQGKWNFNTERYLVNGMEVQAATEYSENEPGCSDDFIQFNADMTTAEGDYYAGATSCELSTTSGTWSSAGNTVTVVSNGVSTDYVVTAMSANTMTAQDIYTSNGVTGTAEYTFTRHE